MLSYRALDDASARVAGLLASRGVGPGDRVGIMLPNVPLFPVIYYGILRLGATVVPMNVLLKGRETAHYLKDPGAKAVFAWQSFAEHAQTGAAEAAAECIEVEPEDFARLLQDAEPHSAVTPRDGSETAVILYTSGTTGVPKGAELSHDNLAHNCRAAAGLFGIGAATVTLGALPLFHSFGQTCAMNATICVGGCLTLIPRFDPAKALEVIERDRVSVFEGVPTMYGALLNDPRRRRRRRVVAAGLRVRRRVAAARAHARVRGEVLDDHPRGLRPVGDRARRVASTIPTASARRDRSARRSRAWRCGSSARMARSCPPARSARS